MTSSKIGLSAYWTQRCLSLRMEEGNVSLLSHFERQANMFNFFENQRRLESTKKDESTKNKPPLSLISNLLYVNRFLKCSSYFRTFSTKIGYRYWLVRTLLLPKWPK